MCDELLIRRLAGVFILGSIVLATVFSPLWLAFTAFVGVNLLQSSFTRFCPLERVLGHFGIAGCRPGR